jgi:hypothetical protein
LLDLDGSKTRPYTVCWWPVHERGARAHIEPGRYNAFVCAVSPPPDQRPRKLRIHKLEAGGILIIGALILLLILARYWHHIAWSAR